MEPKAEPRPHVARILVVEDEVAIRCLLTDELRDAGFAVVEAARADEALSYLKTAGAVDLVFTDIQTPGSLDGVELARQIRAEFPSIPVILTSGNVGPQSVDGLGLFVPKPYEIGHAVAIVFHTLGLMPPENLKCVNPAS
jgi:CheY-like chemotaxis protein